MHQILSLMRDHLNKVVQRFRVDPADSSYQRGYEAAYRDMRETLDAIEMEFYNED